MKTCIKQTTGIKKVPMYEIFLNLYKPNICVFQTQKLVQRRFGLDMFHCTSYLGAVLGQVKWFL